MNKLACLILLCICVTRAWAQLPETRIYIMDLKNYRGNITLSGPKLASNNKGYNNQPFFMDDDRTLLFTSNKGKGLTDIYKYDILKKSIKRLTNTDNEAEYSPRQSLGENEITCVRVEKDTVTQHFYAYNYKGKKGHLLLPDVTQLGYYTWLNGAEVIALTLPEPFVLSKYNVITLKADTLLTHPGRTFVNHHSKLYFVDKADSNHYYIKIMAKENLRPKKNKPKVENTTIIETLTGQEDFCVLNDGTILMGKDGILYAYNPKKIKGVVQQTWKEVANLNTMGIGTFYRLVVNADNSKIAVVGYVGEKP
jgi:hypothetical protein